MIKRQELSGLSVQQIKTESLIPYARNAKKHPPAQIASIASSIKEFGFNVPVLVDGKNGIIAGHGRVLAAQKLGIESIPCIRIEHLSENQKRAYILADNRLSETGGGWDEEMLKLEVKDIDWAELKEIQLDAFDFGSIEFEEEKKVCENAEADAEPQEDKLEDLREKWDVKLGQLWQLGEHKIICGDSTSREVVSRLLGDEKPHLMVTDPPYGVEYDASWRTESLGNSIGGTATGKVMNDDRADWSSAWELFPGDAAYVWHAALMSAEASDSLVKTGFSIRSQIIWAKHVFVPGRGHYHWQHEPCWYAVRKGKTGHYNGDRTQSTLWEIYRPKKSETGHSTQKPIECMERPIRNNSKNGDLIYEPFSGSGTTIIACERTGRRCRAIELNPVYVAVAIERWREATGKDPVLVG